ncbi:MAG: DsbA family oxidoreductase [Actinomycetota bacterium]
MTVQRDAPADTDTDTEVAGRTGRPIVSVEIWSDVVCPWCYIGKRRFEEGMALAHAAGDLGVDLDVSFKPFQLDPKAAPGVAGPVFDAYVKKFGGEDQARSIIDRVTAEAAANGLEFRMDRALRANTLLAHRLIWWAGRPDTPVDQHDMKERLLQAYFMEGRHVGDVDQLAHLAADVGADHGDVTAFLESDEGTEEVGAELRHAYENGITAVPTYVFNGEWAVPGAQDPVTFAKVLERLATQAIERAAGGGTDRAG